MKQIAIIPSRGVGDALLMLIAAQFHYAQGDAVDVYHDTISELAPWFPHFKFKKTQGANYDKYDLIIAENDNSPKIQELITSYRERLSIYYPTYNPSKHSPQYPLDALFDPTQSMVSNIARHLQADSPSNGITPPAHLHHRAHLKRVIIHPTSHEPKKNWRKEAFAHLAKKLQGEGFFPLFVVSPKERPEWEWLERTGLPFETPASLSDLATLIYESGYLIGNDSGAGHLASNLEIPSLIIGSDAKRLALWRPGWHPATLLYPPRLFRRFWKRLISSKKAKNTFLSQVV